MRRTKRMLALITGVVMLGLVTESGAADFSPTIDFQLGQRRASLNTTLKVTVKQERGEEELKTVELRIPAGFSLAVDQQLRHNELLANGEIVIDAGPRCRPGGPPEGSAPATVPAEIVEHDRTSAQIASGVQAVYFLDLEPVTRIALEVTGSPTKGWKLEGLVPANEFTCPPFSFTATFLERSAETDTPIITNPPSGGTYTFEAKFVGLSNSVAELSQVVTIEGPADGGGGSTLSDAEKRKKCRRIKNKQRRRKCLRRLKG